MSTRGDDASDIAVIGMAGRFPGAANLATFWTNLCSGVESIRLLTDSELDALGVSPALRSDPHYVRATAALEGMELFDAAFFGYSPREAELMDPQHRIFLECCWEALEDAGYAPDACPGSVGVFAGATTNTYMIYNLLANSALFGEVDPMQVDVANGTDFLTTRVAYKLGLRGPSFTVLSACSTSLLATHVACQSLLNEECDIALAGGVSIQVDHPRGYKCLPGSIMSLDGHCRAFDARANGTVFGSGAGVAVLKRLADALADGDHVYAVIKGTAANNDGSVKVGYTAPAVDGQARVIREAWAVAGLSPEAASYVETHGTGTALGDPIEIRALAKAWGRGRGTPIRSRVPCLLGALKTNVGHLGAAAGVASLLKTVLALAHRRIPPTLHFSQPNPDIDFSQGPFVVNTALTEWPADPSGPRRAGVSSFGVGGTNVHAALQEAPVLAPTGTSRRGHLLMISAKTSTALETATINLGQYLTAHPACDLADVAYTLQVGRSAMSERCALYCRDREEALQVLATRDPERLFTATAKSAAVAFLLLGRGSRGPDLARAMYQDEPTFRRHLDACAAAWVSPPGDDALQRLEALGIAEAAGFAVEYSVAQLWMSWGLAPTALMGLGRAELVAACLAGVYSLHDALALLTAREAGARVPQADATTQVESVPQPVRRIRLHPPRIPVVSNRSGTWLTAAEAIDPNYWLTSLPRTASLEPMLQTLRAGPSPNSILLAVGPVDVPGDAETEAALLACSVVRAVARSASDRTSVHAPLSKALGQLWSRGAPIDWNAFYAHERRRRLSLPTYPFERHRYWIDAPSGQLGSVTATAAVTPIKKPDLADWFYLPTWKRLPIPLSRRAEGATDRRGWLIFADECGVAEALVHRLSQLAQPVTLVYPGTRFELGASSERRIDPTRREDYAALLAAVRKDKRPFDRVLHLWNVTAGPGSVARALELGLFSLVYLAQALFAEAISAPIAWWVAANGVCQVESTDPLWPEKAPLLGPCRVLPQEYSQLTCRFIDVAPRAGATPVEIAEGLLAEAESASHEPVIALRGRQRWVQSYEALRIEETAKVARRLREGGVYLITGGLAGIGWTLAQNLARTCRAKLVLIEATAFPDKSAWADFLQTKATDDKMSHQLRSLQRLEADGAEVWVSQAAVHDEVAMRRGVAQALQHFGRIDGVIHALGGWPDASMMLSSEITPASTAACFESQIHGLLTLGKVLPAQGLDFCLVVSSLSATLGGIGQTVQAAVSHYADAFAAQRSEQGATPWISVGWDAWRFAGDDTFLPPSSALAKTAILPEEGVEAARRIMTQALGGPLIVSTTELESRRRTQSPAAARPKRVAHPRPALEVPYAAPRSELESTLATVWHEVLGVEPVGLDDNFFELGGDSLLAVQVSAQLERAVATHVPAAVLYQRPTLRALVELLQHGGDTAAQQRAEKLARRKEAFAQRVKGLPRRGH